MSWNKNRAIEELAKGKDLTNQLRDLLSSKPFGEDGSNYLVGGEDLVMKIFNSFSNTLSILRNSSSGDYDEVSQLNPRNNNSYDGRKSEDSDSWTRDTLTLIDDGYAWRKYGQKTILNANHSRNYFRCTHKNDQGCQATKQVQQIEDDPPKYRTIYYGHHTCKTLLKASQLILDSTTSNDSSFLLSFTNNTKQDNPFFSCFPSAVKQETKESDLQQPASDITCNRSSSSSSDYLLSPDHLTTFASSAPMAMLSVEDQDVISAAGVVDSVDFDDFEF
ncbi:DNA-binding WRKY [Corchorus olitorius]|uniref:DNA-binding WRKY n=1 Tax=Corchorus olitorius TaxID=93759 RepID=A0A1R3G1W3_9ROSI|nr:DNA-binding WRKY [Corchorus olitorius]